METQLSKQPSKKKMCEFKQLNPLLKSGVFTKEEDNLILQYCYKFQQVHIFKIKKLFYLPLKALIATIFNVNLQCIMLIFIFYL